MRNEAVTMSSRDLESHQPSAPWISFFHMTFRASFTPAGIMTTLFL